VAPNGTNTYIGTTTVTGGKLIINGNNNGNGKVTVTTSLHWREEEASPAKWKWPEHWSQAIIPINTFT
jgi:hypothetical protein